MIIKKNSDKNAFCDSYWIKAFLKAKFGYIARIGSPLGGSSFHFGNNHFF